MMVVVVTVRVPVTAPMIVMIMVVMIMAVVVMGVRHAAMSHPRLRRSMRRSSHQSLGAPCGGREAGRPILDQPLNLSLVGVGGHE